MTLLKLVELLKHMIEMKLEHGSILRGWLFISQVIIEMKLENGSIVLQLDSGDGCSFLRCNVP